MSENVEIFSPDEHGNVTILPRTEPIDSNEPLFDSQVSLCYVNKLDFSYQEILYMQLIIQ